jgi:alpha-glucosidase
MLHFNEWSIKSHASIKNFPIFFNLFSFFKQNNMRQNIAEGFKLKDSQHPFIFENSGGHIFKIMIISSNIVRIQYLTPTDVKKSEEQQYSINDKEIYIKETVSLNGNTKRMEIETPSIRLVVVLEPSFQLSWYSVGDDKDDTPFAEDLAYRSYGYDKMTSDKWHYQRKFQNNRYYGLGERSGSLDLGGKRFRLERLDCMGYDAETSDPLYKFCPFYINLSPHSKKAYGVYYNNFSKTTIDLGQELDAVI